MTVYTDDNLVYKDFPRQKLEDGDTAYVTMHENTASNHFISFQTKIGVNSHPDTYHYFSTARLAEAYCTFRNTGQLELNMSERTITNGLNTQDGKYLKIGTEAFRTTDEEGTIIRCKIGKKSNPWKYEYFSTRKLGEEYWLKGNNTVEEVEVKVEDLANYDKEAVLKVAPYIFTKYGSYNKRDNTFSGRQDYLDTLTKITLSSNYKVKDLADLFYYLILMRSPTSNCTSGRARTADDLYLLAKYQFKIDITFEECYKILCLVANKKALFSSNFYISISWCGDVCRNVTGPNFPNNKTQEDFREFFNKIKCNREING